MAGHQLCLRNASRRAKFGKLISSCAEDLTLQTPVCAHKDGGLARTWTWGRTYQPSFAAPHNTTSPSTTRGLFWQIYLYFRVYCGYRKYGRNISIVGLAMLSGVEAASTTLAPYSQRMMLEILDYASSG